MNEWFTAVFVLIALLLLMALFEIQDVSGLPFAWRVVATVIGFVCVFMAVWVRPAKQDGAEAGSSFTAHTTGPNSPIYQAAGNISVINPSGLSDADKLWMTEAIKRLAVNDGPDDRSYPGIAFFFASKIMEQTENRRKFLFDFGTGKDRARFSAYMTEDNALAFRVIDQTGETNTIRVPRNEIKIGTRSCWLFEIGKIDNRSFLRISQNGKRLQSGIVNYPIDESIFSAGSLTVFADMDGQNHGKGEFYANGVFTGTLTTKQQAEFLGKYY
jgi:hypothetical protein